ncbi:MAG: hypothetical protein RL072_928 [Actinomycetota bacterium]|jgi:uncharacterized protein (DUF1015 family)
MPAFFPFRGLRYSRNYDLAAVTAPPYDVLSSSDRSDLAALHEHNIVTVDLPVGDDPYAGAARTLDAWRSSGVLVLDERPSFTLYRMKFLDSSGAQRRTVGVIGALEVMDEGSGGVLPHERTTTKAKTDRLDLTRATRTNLSPVWGLSLREQLSDALVAGGELMGEFTDATGVHHRVERVDDSARVRSISSLVGSAPVLIADGHHRYAIARTYRDEVRDSPLAEAARTTMTYVGELVEEQLSIAAIHRLYQGVSFDRLRDVLATSFDVLPLDHGVDSSVIGEMSRRGALCLVDTFMNGWWLTPKPSAFSGLRDLDSLRLEHALRSISHEVAYQHGFGEVEALMRTGHAVAAIFIRPTSIAEIRRTADETLLMPPKSTFFTPKLRTGLVLRPLIA